MVTAAEGAEEYYTVEHHAARLETLDEAKHSGRRHSSSMAPLSAAAAVCAVDPVETATQTPSVGPGARPA